MCFGEATETGVPLEHTANESTILIPVVLGLGCSKLRHKMAALVHQFHLEVGAECIQEYCLSVVGICSDQGVEAGLYEAPAFDLRRHLELEAAALNCDSALHLNGGGADALLFPLEVPEDALQLRGGSEDWSPEQDREGT